MTQVVVERASGVVRYLDPCGAVYTVPRQSGRRLDGVKGLVAGLVDKGNDTSSALFKELANILYDQYGVEKVILKTKLNHTKPCPTEIFEGVKQEADFLVAGVAL